MTCCGGSGLCRVHGNVRGRAAVEREITRRAVERLRAAGWRPVLLDGIRVRWLGVVWRGVPEPLRWVLEWRSLLPGELPGCGCIDRLKGWVERMAPIR